MGTRRESEPGSWIVQAAADALWPGRAVLGPRSSGRTSPMPPRATSYAIVPSLSRPRYLVPPDAQAATALRPSSAGLRGVPMRAMSWLQRHSVLHRVSRRHLHVGPGTGEGIEDLLEAMVGDVEHVVVRLGRPRPNRTLVLWALAHDGSPRAIVKLSRGPVATAALEAEFSVLAEAPATGVSGLVAPACLGYARWGGNDVMAISILSRPGAGPSHDPPVAQMLGLAGSAGARDVALRSSPFATALAAQVDALLRAEDRAWLRAGLERLLADLGDVTVRTGAWHGDWVAWNQAVDERGVLLWDWEHYATAALAGFDHVHFLAQEQRARGTGTRAEDAWLASAHAALAGTWGLDEPARWAVLRGYLLEVNLRFVRDRQHEDQPSARPGWARPLVERLAGTRRG